MQPPQLIFWKQLMSAIEADDSKAIDAMLAAGVENFAPLLSAHHPLDQAKRTPLMLAYWWGRPLAATALVNAGSLYQQEDANGNGAAWYARRFGKGEAEARMSSLIDAGERRLSMSKLISTSAAPANPPPKRRSGGV